MQRIAWIVSRLVVGLIITGCSRAPLGDDLPPQPSPTEVAKWADATTDVLGQTFKAVFVCGRSIGKAFQPTRGGQSWIDGTGAEAVIAAISDEGALEVLRVEAGELRPVTQAGGLVVPVKFDPVIGDIAVAVAYPQDGVSETYAFSTFNGGPSFLSWTVNVPQQSGRAAGRGVEALIAQCVEVKIDPVSPK
jgi:hypothetical protein